MSRLRISVPIQIIVFCSVCFAGAPCFAVSVMSSGPSEIRAGEEFLVNALDFANLGYLANPDRTRYE